MAFAQAAGFMNADEVAKAKQNGPGGCKSKEECDAFCNKPENQPICKQFGGQNGQTPQDTNGIQPGMKGPKEALSEASPEALACLQGSLGNDAVEQIKSGLRMPTQIEGDKMKACLSVASQPVQSGPVDGGTAGGPKQSGPGGCSSQAECDAYCQTHREECAAFGPGQGPQQPMQQPMPQNQPMDGPPQGGGNPPMPTNQMMPMNPVQSPGENQGATTQQIPQAPPSQPAPQNPEPQSAPADGNQPSGFLNPQSLLGSLIQAFVSLLSRK